MRVFILPVAAMTALILSACSGGTEGTTLQRGRSASSTPAVEAAAGAKGGASNASNASNASPTAPSAPPPPDSSAASTTSDAGAGATPAPAPAPAPTPAAPGTCGNPKCLGGDGLAGCKATDGAGDLVTMGCQDGACACFTGGQETIEFDGDVNSADDAVQLFLTNCTCN
jgi:hypothetical protein